MKYQCGIIKDLLPIYIEELCTSESKKIVEEHLEECSDCKQHYLQMKSFGDGVCNEKNEDDKAFLESLKKVKKQIKLKHIFISLMTVAVVSAFAAISWVAAYGMKHIEYPILYEDNIYVDTETPDEWEDLSVYDSYYVHCKGHTIEGVFNELVVISDGEKTEKYLFFQLTTNKWYDFITPKNKITHQPFTDIKEMGIDKLYYYPGYMEDIEYLAEGELESIISNSELIWESEG